MAYAHRLPIADLVRHLRTWVSHPRTQPRSFYARHLDMVAGMTDDELVEIVRFVATTRGAEMALVNHIRQRVEVTA